MFLRSVALALMLIPWLPSRQQAVLPPPKPPDSGPSLDVTLRFIQEKVGYLGTVNYSVFGSDTADPNTTYSQVVSTQYSAVVYNAGTCYLQYHVKRTQGGDTFQNADVRLSLREVEDITVEPEEQRRTKRAQAMGQSTTEFARSQPATLALVIHRPHNVEDVFDFQDASTADRVAKAFSHAVELCGGGNKDPF